MHVSPLEVIDQLALIARCECLRSSYLDDYLI